MNNSHAPSVTMTVTRAGILLAILCAIVPIICVRADDGRLQLKSSPDPEIGPLSGLFDMANGFAHAAFADSDYILEFVNKTLKEVDEDKFEFSAKTVWEVIKRVPGFFFCVLVGLLFLIFVPIVGFCFCCCRCCGNCGGRMHQDQPEKATKQRAFEGVLTVVMVIILAGCGCMFGIFVYLNDVIPQVQPSTDDILDDVGSFARKTRADIQSLSDMMIADINKTMDDVLTADSINEKISQNMVTVLNREADLSSINASVQTLQRDIESTKTKIDGIKVSAIDMKANATKLKMDLESSVTSITNSLSACGRAGTAECTTFQRTHDLSNLLAAGFDPNTIKVDVVDTIASDVANIASENYPEKFQKGIDSLHDKIRNSSEKAVEDVRKQFDDANFEGEIRTGTKRVTDGLKQVENLRSEAHDVIKYFAYPQKYYDKYGKYVVAGIPGLLMLLWIVLPLCGLLLGVCGGSPLKNPLKRSSASTAGGHILMTTVYLTFIFSWIFMLVTWFAFMTGAIVENLGCRPLKDFTMLGKIESIAAAHGSSIYEALPANLPLPQNITISGILKNCDAKSDFFDTMGLGQALDNMIKEYKEDIDVDSQVQEVSKNIDFSTVKIMTPELETALNDADTKIKAFDYANVKTELSGIDSSKLPDPSRVANDLQALVNTLPSATPGQPELAAEVAKLNLMAHEVDDLRTMQTSIITSVEQLSAEKNSYTVKITELKNRLNELQVKVRTEGKNMTKTAVKGFADDIMGRVDDLADKVKNKARKVLKSGCHVLSTLYHTAVDKIICGYVISPFNGLWFSLGQCVVFSLQIIIFGTLLAKFYRRMLTSDFSDYPKDTWPQADFFDDPRDTQPKSKHSEMNEYVPVYPKLGPSMNRNRVRPMNY